MGGRKTDPNLTDRARPGSRHHILADANGVPISAILSGANRNDVTQLLPLVDAIPPIRGTRGRPLQRPKVIYADRGPCEQRIVRNLPVSSIVLAAQAARSPSDRLTSSIEKETIHVGR